MFGLSVFGLRGLLDIRDALRSAELNRLASPAHWQATRAWLGLAAAVPVFFAGSALAGGAWLAAAAVAALGYSVAPQFLASARQRVEQELLDDLPVHLDLIALAMEAGWALPAALATCAHRAPEGALRRAWARVILEIHAARNRSRRCAHWSSARASSRWPCSDGAAFGGKVRHPCCAGVP